VESYKLIDFDKKITFHNIMGLSVLFHFLLFRRTRKITFQNEGPLNLWGLIWPNNLSTHKSGPELITVYTAQNQRDIPIKCYTIGHFASWTFNRQDNSDKDERPCWRYTFGRTMPKIVLIIRPKRRIASGESSKYSTGQKRRSRVRLWLRRKWTDFDEI